MKISLIITVLNEMHTVEHLISSIKDQTLAPDELIIVDGGSTDGTLDKLEELTQHIQPPTKVSLLQKPGNRSVGRNEAISHATGDIIVCTDAGCFPEKKWIAEIVKPFSDPLIDVVAGYYEAKTETVFQECLVPFVFVMPDKIRASKFLPATRSMAFKKSIWEQVGRFPEEYSHNEDYVFARRLRAMDAKIAFHKEAIVYWIPRKTFAQAYNMFYRFALGDAESGMHRPKVYFVFARYLAGFVLLLLAVLFQSIPLFALCALLFALYVAWAIAKNWRYVDEIPALYYLPALQFTADAAVLTGSVKGYFNRH